MVGWGRDGGGVTWGGTSPRTKHRARAKARARARSRPPSTLAPRGGSKEDTVGVVAAGGAGVGGVVVVVIGVGGVVVCGGGVGGGITSTF